MTLETMIGSLSREEQLKAMELLWRQITTGSDPIEPPSWHRDTVRERIERIESGEAKLLDWEDVKSGRSKFDG
jgi:hypothetical protein